MRSSLAEGPVAIYSTALRYNKKDALALLKNKNVNIQQEQNGFTAIHYASIGGEANVVKILITQRKPQHWIIGSSCTRKISKDLISNKS